MRLYQRVIVWATAILLVAAVGKQLADKSISIAAMSHLGSLPVIVIDPGHGGIDGGAVANGVVEKDVNLAISLTLRDMFIASGFRVVMTRETDISIHDEVVTSTRKQKTSDLHNRLAIAEDQPSAIFLSIHQNKFEQSSSRGTQIFYSPNNEQSERLATILQESFVANLQPDNTRQIKKAGDNLYLMWSAKCPAVLIECGFLSNPEEAARLTKSEYQNQVAFTILGSVVRFWGLDRPVVVGE
jgi:N-acetylmuramoyl-L-alanine amidase